MSNVQQVAAPANLVVAGIIDLRTGEIQQTVTAPGQKTALRLKVRDELNKVHGDVFCVFEVNTALGGNVSWVAGKMLTKDPHATRGMHFHKTRYDVYKAQRMLLALRNDLAMLESVYKDCLSLYKWEGLGAKRQVVEDAFEAQLTEGAAAVREQEQTLARLQKKLEGFAAESAIFLG